MESLIVVTSPWRRAGYALAAVFLFQFVLLCAFAHPAVDDYAYAVETLEHGSWEAQAAFYQNWSGRYVATFFLVNSPLAFGGLWLYRLLPLLVGGALFYGLLTTLRFFARQSNTAVPARSAALGLMVVLLSGMPSMAQALYWMAGSFTYMLPLAALLVLVPLGWDLLSGAESRSSRVAVVSLLTVLVVGSNETVMLLLGLLVAGSLVWVFKRRRSALGPWIGVATVALAAALAVILSPGNEARRAFWPQVSIPWAAGQAALDALLHLTEWLSPALFVGLIIACRWVVVERVSLPAGWVQRRARLATLGVLVAVLIVGFFPAWAAMGQTPPRRVDNMLFVLFVLLLLFGTVQHAVLHQKRLARLFEGRRWLGLGPLVVVLVLSASVYRNGFWAARDLTTRAARWDHSMDARYTLMKENPGAELRVEPASIPPKTLFFDDISGDASDWRNTSYARYYGLTSIRVEVDAE